MRICPIQTRATARWRWSCQTIATVLRWVSRCCTNRGTTGRINGGAVALVAKLIEDGTGEDLEAYAAARLFEPLGITQYEWVRGADGVAAAASGLRLTAPGLARIGQLILDEGRWQGEQIVPERWLAASFEPRATLEGLRYGYLWWLAAQGEPAGLGGGVWQWRPKADGAAEIRAERGGVCRKLQSAGCLAGAGGGDRALCCAGNKGAIAEVTPGPKPESDFPWWLLAAGGLAAWFLYRVVADNLYAQVLSTVSKGIGITIAVTLVAFAAASLIGLALALASLSGALVLRQAARFYIEIVRGIPIIVLLLYVAFVLAPGLVALVNWVAAHLGAEPIRTRDFPLLWRAVLALTIGYSAFYRRGVSRGHPIGGCRADRGGGQFRLFPLAALSAHRVSAGVSHHPAAAWQ